MCKYCTKDTEKLEDLLWSKTPLFKNVDAYFQITVKENKLSLSLSAINGTSIDAGCNIGAAKIKYCPMCGRKLSNEIDWENLTPQERNAYLGIFS